MQITTIFLHNIISATRKAGVTQLVAETTIAAAPSSRKYRVDISVSDVGVSAQLAVSECVDDATAELNKTLLVSESIIIAARVMYLC